jgi:hypothetical protein
MRILAVALVPCLSGCFPMHFNVYPGAGGRVVDASTSAPIANAIVTLTPGGLAQGHPAKSIRTDSDGRFSFAPEKAWGVYVVPMDFAPLLARISVSAPGYDDGTCQVRSSPDGPGIAACGDVRLAKRP